MQDIQNHHVFVYWLMLLALLAGAAAIIWLIFQVAFKLGILATAVVLVAAAGALGVKLWV